GGGDGAVLQEEELAVADRAARTETRRRYTPAPRSLAPLKERSHGEEERRERRDRHEGGGRGPEPPARARARRHRPVQPLRADGLRPRQNPDRGLAPDRGDRGDGPRAEDRRVDHGARRASVAQDRAA